MFFLNEGIFMFVKNDALFKFNTNKVSIITKDDAVLSFEKKPKNQVALDILNVIHQSFTK